MIDTLINRIRFDITNSFALLDKWFDQDSSQLNQSPGAGGWTSLQILEHVMLTNHYLLILIEKGCAKALKNAQTMKIEIDGSLDSLSRKELQDVGEHKSFVWDRPEHMEPKGNLPLHEIRLTIKTQRDLCLDCLDKLRHGEGLLYKTTMSVNNLGKLNVYEYIEFLTLHIVRHLQQLESNRKNYLETEDDFTEKIISPCGSERT